MTGLFRNSVLILIFCVGAYGTHFRGGTFSWRSLYQVDGMHQIQISYRLSWRRDYNTPPCNETMIQSMTSGYSSGAWAYHNVLGVDITNEANDMICTAYDSSLNWAFGHNSFVVGINTTGIFQISFTGNSWISGTVSNAVNWALAAGSIDVAPRSDTGIANRPPTSTAATMIRLIQGCPEDIVIKYQDEDNDRVSCRYARNDTDPDECGSVCNGVFDDGYAHFTLNQTTCTVHYDGGGGAVLVIVPIILEDHPTSNIVLAGSRNVSTSQYLSQIPLQFILEVVESRSCNVLPTYPSFSVMENEDILIFINGTFNRTLYAYPSSSITTITQFIILGPLGMWTDIITNAGENLYSTHLIWQPASDQIGTYDVCYYAADSEGSNGRQVCFTVTVSAAAGPCEIGNGGCSDICGFDGYDRTCTCALPCWRLDLDGETCLPEMNISCDGQGMRISMDECASNSTVFAGDTRDHIAQEQCQSTREGNHYLLNWEANTCGMTYQVNPVQVQYTGNLWVWYSTSANSSSVIMRGEYRRIPAQCSMSTAEELSVSFIPQVPFDNESFPVEIYLEGFGQFVFYFEFYRTSAFSSVIAPSEYPMTVSTADMIYFAIGAIGQAGFAFFTEQCVAVTSPTEQTQLTYTFLKEGCLLDSTLSRIPTDNPMEERLSMQAFDFTNALTSSSVTEILLQCKVMICDATNTTSRCFQGCVSSNRKKRSFADRAESSIIDDDENDDDDSVAILTRTTAESPLLSVKGRIILVKERPSSDVVPGEASTLLIAVGMIFCISTTFI